MDTRPAPIATAILCAALTSLLLLPATSPAAQGNSHDAAHAPANHSAGGPNHSRRALARIVRRAHICRASFGRARRNSAVAAAWRHRVRHARRLCARLRTSNRRDRLIARRYTRLRMMRLRARAKQARGNLGDADETLGDSVADSSNSEGPDILFRGDFEDGFDSWHVQSLDYRATLSAGVQGAKAGRFEVREGDVEPETGSQRSEVSGPTFDEGQDLYIRDEIRMSDSNTFEGSWQIVQQLHEEDWNGSPGLAVFLDEDDVLSIRSGDSSRTYWDGEKLERDRWYDLVYRVNLSQNPSEGFVEVWLDGRQQTLADGESRVYGETTQEPQTYLKAGIYRSHSSSGTSVVEHDAFLVGTSLAAVNAG